ncbi:MAG: heavy metal translocating P-type ATPase, partial [Eubacterium sp.]|nr:heavy metal translocating P-type ATPase [Eubacterium sp.]
MRFTIKHEIRNRLRIHLPMERMTFREADTFEYYLKSFSEIREVKVYERTADAVIVFGCDRERVLDIVKGFSFETISVPERVFGASGREMSAKYYDKLVTTVILHLAKQLLLPFDIRRVWTAVNTVKFVWRGIKTLKNRQLQVELLDAIAITAAGLTGEYNTASSVMSLLKIGDTLEEWTHKRSVDDLARRMSLNIDKVWLCTDEGEMLTDSSDIKCGDKVVVRIGNMIPFDGVVVSGEAMVNQAAMTGESLAVHK